MNVTIFKAFRWAFYLQPIFPILNGVDNNEPVRKSELMKSPIDYPLLNCVLHDPDSKHCHPGAL